MTHSAALVLVAVTDAAPVGIDVELRQDSIDAEAIAWYISGPGEDPPTGAAAAVRAWCRKEAVVKATGDGLSVPLRDVPISSTGQLIEPHRGNHVALHDLELDVDHPGYTAAVAVLAAGVVVPRILDGAALLQGENGDRP
ncbi:4'-phosphopantetheinyl transferase family protein [Aeromicrobium sp. CF3.5]|uniref:4'-phosphopantetheinyl transferase family protein n=1 Tax=Aeromicrobium sp. CF3.5 TaxID=3373078 RepID=UPI003EE676A0